MLHLDIDISAVLHNIEIIRSSVDAELNAVIKANCYGHGIELAKFIEPYVDSFSVSSVKEAKEAIACGITKKIYILGTINPADFESIDNVVYTVCSKDDIGFLQTKGKNYSVAVKINSGMNRLGVHPIAFTELMESISNQKKIVLDSVFTHFYNTSAGSHKHQFEIFEGLTKNLHTKKHCCASNCLSLEKRYHLDMVRCGIAIYGYGNEKLKPSLKAYSTISQINDVSAGEYVGYGDFLQNKDIRCAIIRAGYADGYRRISKPQFASAHKQRAKIIGQVSMDLTAVDISGIDIQKNDKIYLIDEVVRADELAFLHDTIVYEILTSFNACRVERRYHY